MSIEVEDLNFAYCGEDLLSHISFSATKGEFIGILGPNGCGKSTLLKNILKILEPKSATISIESKPLKEYSLKELAKTLGFVPQKSALSMPLLVEELLLMGRFAHMKNSFDGYSKDDLKKIDEVMELLDICHFKKRVATSLSGGEFQRVLLARALVCEPKALLLDEPTSALDLNFAVEIMKICSNLTKKMNLLFIMVLHDLNLAAMFCDRIIMLKDGKIAYDSTPKKLYTKEILEEIYALKCEVINHRHYPVVVALKE